VILRHSPTGGRDPRYARGTTVWERYLEWCAEMFGVTVRSKLGQLVLFALTLFALGLVLSMRWGLGAWALPIALVALSAAAARQVAAARDAVWQAACGTLGEDAGVAPALGPPTALSLRQLADAVRAVRRGRYADATAIIPSIHRDLLRAEERQLLDAVVAMISASTGATERAAQQAVAALPTGSADLDAWLGRAVVTDAWNDPDRLAAIQRAWEHAGVKDGPLLRLRTLVRVRIDAGVLDELPGAEARELSDEARAIGDEELASELSARSRPTAYR
jgi:hypothetical protein